MKIEYWKKKHRKIDFELFNKQHKIKKWKRSSEGKSHRSKLFEKNLPFSTLIFVGKQHKECLELIKKFDEKKLKSTPIQYVLETTSKQKPKPETYSLAVLTKLKRERNWSLTTLSITKQTHPSVKNLLLLALYRMYNFGDFIGKKSTVSVFPQKQDSVMINELTILGFEKKIKNSNKTRVEFVLTKWNLMKICNNKNVPKKNVPFK